MRKGISGLLICVQVLLGIIGFHQPVYAGEAEGTVRVGYIEQCDFIKKQKGVFSGFAIDYLELIAKDTGWKYEYVATDREECQKLLETGEVDMLCISQQEREWEDSFLYSQASLGFEYFLIYSNEESDIYYEDYQAMDGLRVGILEDNHFMPELNMLMKEYAITLEPAYYSNKEDLMTALKEGQINLLITGSFDSHSDLKLVGRFGGQSIYCITKKQNQQLMKNFDDALQTVKIQKPDTAAELLQKYFENKSYSCGPLYTREEYNYIEKAEPVKVSMRLRSHPLSYSVKGDYGGIYVDYLKLLSEKSGLKFELIFDTENLPIEQRSLKMLKEDCLVLLPGSIVSEYQMENVIMSNTLLNSNLSYVKRRNDITKESKEDYVFALTKDINYLLPLLQEVSEKYQFIFCDSTEMCLNVVYEGLADIAIQDNYAVRYLLQKPKYAEKLAAYPGEEFSMDLCLVGTKDKQMLIQVLNKAIDQITMDDVERLVTTELLVNPYQIDAKDWFYKYRRVLIFTGLLIVIAIVVYTILLRKMTELSVRKKDYDSLKNKVQQDIITGVYNRYSFYEKAKEMITATEDPMCIVMADVSNFKVINDLYGMELGDKLLKYMAKQLKALGEGRDMIIARFTGDHFYMCLREKDFKEIEFPKRFKTFLQDMEVSVSYGVFNVRDQKDLPVNIMCDRASLAVHDRERKSVEYIRYYSGEERSRIIQQQEIENDMEKALENRQFCVYVQPKYDINEGTIVGGEALVRWKHPQKGMISPGVFIDIFEKNGFIIRLDYFVWEEACRLLAELKKQGIEGYPISINVSRAHFYGTDLLNKLKELIEKYQLEPQDLELEITESICGEDQDSIYKKIRKLQEAGFRVAMDDFGSGYSSLNMLKEMPLDIIKMDLKFLDGGDDEEKSRNILYTLISLAQNLQLFVVVEGVETEEQVEFLRQIGNHYVQGYYFSRPVESEAYEEMLKKVTNL